MVIVLVIMLVEVMVKDSRKSGVGVTALPDDILGDHDYWS